MTEADWTKQFPAAITVCDAGGVILSMNDRSATVNAAEGGLALVGTNVLDCHPEHVKAQLAGMLASGKKNAYTIEKQGLKKLIFQSPWYRDGEYAGFVELSLEIPFELPHFVRGA